MSDDRFLIDSAAAWGLAVEPPVEHLDPRFLLPVVEELRMPVPAKGLHLRSAIELVQRAGLWGYALALDTPHFGMSYMPWMKSCEPYVSREDALRAAGRAIEQWVEGQLGACPVEDPQRCTCANRLLKWARETAFAGVCMCCGFEGPERMRACRNGGTCRNCKNGCGALRARRKEENMIDSGRAQPGGDTEIPEPPSPPVVGVPKMTVAEETVGAYEALRLYGDGDRPYDKAWVDQRIGVVWRQNLIGMLETGRLLILYKEHQTHGALQELYERHGIPERTARNLMRAALKFLDGPNRKLLPELNSITKVYELAAMDDEDLDELREGGTIAGSSLDDIARMSPSELRAKLREERAERKEREEAQRARIAGKDRRIEDESERNDILQRRVQAAELPGKRDWYEAATAERVEIARLIMVARDVLSDTREAARRVAEMVTGEEASLPVKEELLAGLAELVGHISGEIDDIEHMVPPSVPDPAAGTEPLPF